MQSFCSKPMQGQTKSGGQRRVWTHRMAVVNQGDVKLCIENSIDIERNQFIEL